MYFAVTVKFVGKKKLFQSKTIYHYFKIMSRSSLKLFSHTSSVSYRGFRWQEANKTKNPKPLFVIWKTLEITLYINKWKLQRCYCKKNKKKHKTQNKTKKPQPFIHWGKKKRISLKQHLYHIGSSRSAFLLWDFHFFLYLFTPRIHILISVG